jgi:NAD(P)-dependent dehydrogenase (short-subunit alcohol dehydrogenase family)
MSSRELKGKSIVLIGGSTGLGLSAAKAFVNAGAKVVIVGRRKESLKRVQSQLGRAVRTLAGDATDPNTARKAVELAAMEFGKVDGLYHVAGGSGRKMGDGPLHAVTNDGWHGTIDLNLSALFFSNRAVVRQFMKQGEGGTILNMGSVLGWSPSPRFFATHAYAAAKSAIIGLTRSIAAYYASQNIRCNVIAPALVETPMAARACQDQAILGFIKTKQPLDGGRVGMPEDCDAAAVFFMSDASRFVTGQVLAVDGGWTVTEGQSGENR